MNHVHFTTADLASTVDWYQRFLGLQVMNSGLFASFFQRARLQNSFFVRGPVGVLIELVQAAAPKELCP